MVESVLRTVFFYFFIVFSFRIMGKREIGQLGIIDLIVSVMIAEISAFSIEKIDESILLAILPIASLVILQLILGYLSVKFRIINKVFEGKPTVLISGGKIIYRNLISQRYSIDDLLLELRKNEISSIEDVEYAVLETNGSLSLFKYNPLKLKKTLPLPIIIEGVIQKETLKHLNKNEIWLNSLLNDNNLKLDEVFYALYKKSHVYVIKKTNE